MIKEHYFSKSIHINITCLLLIIDRLEHNLHVNEFMQKPKLVLKSEIPVM